MKYLPYILILLLIGGIVYLVYFDNPVDTKPFKDKIDSLNTEIKKDHKTIKKLIKEADKSEVKELEYLKEADSLALIISKLNIHDDCPKIVENQGKEIVILRDGLKECNKSKGIYKVTLGVCQEIVVKYEIKEVTNNELNNALQKKFKKEKRKAFIIGSGGTLVLAAILILLL